MVEQRAFCCSSFPQFAWPVLGLGGPGGKGVVLFSGGRGLHQGEIVKVRLRDRIAAGLELFALLWQAVWLLLWVAVVLVTVFYLLTWVFDYG